MARALHREDTAAKVVGAVVTIAQYLPRVATMLFNVASNVFFFIIGTSSSILRGGAEVIGIAFVCLSAAMLFVVYYDPQTKIACFMKPQLCAVNATEILRV